MEVLCIFASDGHYCTCPCFLPAGMHGYINIEKCEGKEVLKKRLSFEERRMIKDWQYFIAAEEITWDYAPNIPPDIDR